ncbi:MAG: glycerophosphodiester phosphodiesterase family protein [bacterium]|nr:glycerophosphodiester phosphodiesterase family protein [bacterium]
MRCFITIIFIILALTACKKDASVYADKSNPYLQTTFIAHKAGGGSNNPFKENTLEAAIYSFGILDGIEIDIQKSRDGTLWLFHDEIIQDENGDDKRITGLKDEEIKNIAKKNGLQLNTLEEILQWKQQTNNSDYISLDIKPWLPTRYSNSQGYLIKLADEIGKLSVKYNCGAQLLAECENGICLKRIKEKDPSIQCYLTTYGDYNKGVYRALKANLDGISFKYINQNISKEQIQELHSKGLRIQLWTINDLAEINIAKDLMPDYIQTDNVLRK